MFCEKAAVRGGRIVRAFQQHYARKNGNALRNSRYTVLSFLPINLGEQLSYPLNVYFLVVAIMQFFAVISPVNPLSTLLPLVLAFALTALKEALDDLKRHREDRIFNDRIYSKLEEDSEVNVMSKDIQAGDVIRVYCHQEVPCDMILMATSSVKNCCQIQTDKIDGETRLKGRQVESGFLKAISGEKVIIDVLKNVKVQCPSLIHHHQEMFQGVLSFKSLHFSIDERQLLPQASALKSSKWILGIVIYTSADRACTRQNSVSIFKRAKLDFRISRFAMGIFALQVLIVVSFGLAGSYFNLPNSPALEVLRWYHWLTIPARFFLLMAIMIPISFKVVTDISKYMASQFIKWDAEMSQCMKGSKRGASVSNTSIAEDLACVKYIMTDKTGTITENEMNFRCFCVPGHQFGIDKEGKLLDFTNLVQQINTRDCTPAMCKLFKHMALCHSIYKSTSDDGGSFLTNGFVSPEDECLVNASARFGFDLIERLPDGKCTLHTPSEVKSFTVLQEFTFTPERRRMSALVYDENEKKRVLLIKGAEEEVLDRLRNGEDRSQITEVINGFSERALRVLVMAQRDVSDDEYTKFMQQSKVCQTSFAGHEQLEALWNTMERGFKLVGACAIGDAIQDGVPVTIDTLRGAGIHIWMLTGDKYQTAFEIAKMSHIISGHHKNYHFSSIETVKEKLNKMGKALQNPHRRRFSISIKGGEVLDTILADHEEFFVVSAMEATSVLIYRAAPSQKAMVTRLVQRHCKRQQVTLAVGDGGNDVAMIQIADVGVGIYGRESTHASRAADFSITRFRHLSRLLLVHGYYCYRRTAYIILYCFYKSMLVSFAQLVFNPLMRFRGISFWDSVQLTLWNGFHTMPIAFATIFDRAYPQDGLLANPSLYREVSAGKCFNCRVFVGFILRGQAQACLLVLSTLWIFGEDLEGTLLSTVAYGIALLLQMIAMVFDSHALTIMHYLAALVTIVLYILTTSLHEFFMPEFQLSRAVALFHCRGLYTLLIINVLPTVWMHCVLILSKSIEVTPQ
ncbi:P-type ATPase [Perkinsela sp. CCAP 1560/4]|nr:P-type ATPase [Perkinsela sp. CCAP 1560/4]KNH08420.1 P-type ATPase [Perkinsela sp. CCAP 1560/4]|eukprot:KNH06950.1 P-type ATPase [Perkinsela sp. CCAP 1560/4]